MKNRFPLLLLFMFFASCTLSAQAIEGDAIIALLGTKVEAPAAKKFFSDYGIDKAMTSVYVAKKNGIRVATDHDTIATVNLYMDNQFFGKYRDSLPEGLHFKMTMEELIKALGKPNYISSETLVGSYCVYRSDKYEFSFQFKDNALEQADFSLKRKR